MVIKELMVKYGDLCRFWLGPDLNIVVSNPDDVKVSVYLLLTTVTGYRITAALSWVSVIKKRK